MIAEAAAPRLTGNPAGLIELDPDVLGEVRAAHREGRLGYLAGASLSRAIGLPSWNEFNFALLRHALPFHRELALDGDHDSAPLARVCLEALVGHALGPAELAHLVAGDELPQALRRALYDHPSLADYRPTEVHCALAALAAAPRAGWPSVHTTNLDDLLERALATVTRGRVAAVHAARRRAPDGPRVVHLSGFFPYTAREGDDERALARTVLVGGPDDDAIGEGSGAGWARRELAALLDARSVIVVGATLADARLRRLIAEVARERRERPAAESHPHYVVMLSRDVDVVVDQMAARAEALLPRNGTVDKRRPFVRALAERACRILEQSERTLWARLGVKTIPVERYDRLNYLLRRIRFADDEWDREHERLRGEWARRRYGGVNFDDPGLQALGTAVLAAARDRLTSATLPIRLHGRCELNLFLPLPDGQYRRIFSSVPGRASAAPRRFAAQHDHFTIPEVERVLALGEPVTSPKILDRRPLPGEAPFEEWYNSIEGVPYFDDEAGGIPVAVIQLCSSERGGAAGELDVDGMIRLRGYLIGVIQSALHALSRYQDAPTIDPQRSR